MKKNIVHLLVIAVLLLLIPISGSHSQQVFAQSGPVFGPETFTRGVNNKAKFVRTFSASDIAIPYTLSITHGNRDGSPRVKKVAVTLNGETLNLNKSKSSFVAATRLQSQNELIIVIKGGAADGFLKVSIEPTRTTLLNSPDDANFDANQSGIGYVYGLSVDSTSHRAYLADGLNDSIIEFDIARARTIRSFDNIDNDFVAGNAGTLSVCLNTSSQSLMVVNQGGTAVGGSQTNGSLSIVNLSDSFVRNFSFSPLGEVHPTSLAGIPNSNVIAMTALFHPQNRRAYFIDTVSGNVTMKDESLALFSSTSNPLTNEFIFAGADDDKRPALFVYGTTSPFRKVKEISSSAKAGSIFDKIAVNPSTNIAVAVNPKESAIYLFDLGAGQEIARIPVRLVSTQYGDTDIAINPETHMAVVTNRNLNLLYVIDLETSILRAEYVLPSGINPLSVGIDTQLNRALIGERGFRGADHSGSVIIVQLPDRD
jgi:DNA-binding beta-propeller fold protein YncE